MSCPDALSRSRCRAHGLRDGKDLVGRDGDPAVTGAMDSRRRAVGADVTVMVQSVQARHRVLVSVAALRPVSPGAAPHANWEARSASQSKCHCVFRCTLQVRYRLMPRRPFPWRHDLVDTLSNGWLMHPGRTVPTTRSPLCRRCNPVVVRADAALRPPRVAFKAQ